MGRFYPAIGDAEPLFVFDDDPAKRANGPAWKRPQTTDTVLVRFVRKEGLGVLQRRGVPTRVTLPIQPQE